MRVLVADGLGALIVAAAAPAVEVGHGSIAVPTRLGLGIDVDEAAFWRLPA